MEYIIKRARDFFYTDLYNFYVKFNDFCKYCVDEEIIKF